MKQILKKIPEFIGLMLSFLCPTWLPLLAKTMMACLYTGFLKRRFKSWGEGSIICWNATKLRGLEYISVGSHVHIDKDVQLTAWDAHQGNTYRPRIVIGDNSTLRKGAHLTAIDGIVIGKNLLTGTNVFITDNAHGTSERANLDVPPNQRTLYSKGAVSIGDNVWLGNNVCVMPGVTIGDGAIVGTGAVVTTDIPPFAVAVGIPARVIKQSPS